MVRSDAPHTGTTYAYDILESTANLVTMTRSKKAETELIYYKKSFALSIKLHKPIVK